MNLKFIQEAIYLKKNGEYFSPRIKYSIYWERYLRKFNKVQVFARIKNVDKLPENYHISSGERVEFIDLPYYQGLIGFLFKWREIINILKSNVSKDNNALYILRIPGILGFLMARILENKSLEYSVEVVGDPQEVLKFLNLPKILKYIIEKYSLKKMSRTVLNAEGALYVTSETLQKKYPAKRGAITCAASNVNINSKDIVNVSRKIHSLKESINYKIYTIGFLGNLYSIKSPLEIYACVISLLKEGFNLKLKFAGDGPLKPLIEKKINNDGFEGKVECLGNLKSGEEVFSFLDDTDIYLQYSKTEGMPRAMIEAMARGCPVLGSDVGGIPELIDAEYIVRSNDIESLKTKIKWLVQHPDELIKASKINIEKSKQYSKEILEKRRDEFYSSLITQNQIAD